MGQFRELIESLTPAKEKSLKNKIYKIIDSFKTTGFINFANDFKNNFEYKIKRIADNDGKVYKTDLQTWVRDGINVQRHDTVFYTWFSLMVFIQSNGRFKLSDTDTEAIDNKVYIETMLKKTDISKIKSDIKRYNKLMKLIGGKEVDIEILDNINFPSIKEVRVKELEKKLQKYYRNKISSSLDVFVKYNKRTNVFSIDVSLQGVRRTTWGALFKTAKRYADSVIPTLKRDGWKITKDYYEKYKKFWDDTEYSEYEMDAGIAQAEITLMKAKKIL